MEKIKIDILKAPTGFGKTQYALELAKKKKVLLAVPTKLIARQVKERAEEMGISVVEIEGRSNYICPYKAKQDNVDIEKLKDNDYKVDGEYLKYAQDIVCCRRKTCEFDPLGLLKQRILVENPDLVITTHSFLKTLSFAEIFDKNRILVIDEVHQFIRGLKEPVQETFISLSSLLPYFYELKYSGISSKVREAADKGIKYIDKQLNTGKTGNYILWIMREDGKLVETEHKEERNEFKRILSDLEKIIEKIQDAMPKKSKKVEVINLRELGTSILKKVRNIQKIKNRGNYAFIEYKNSNYPDIRLGLKQILFSPSMWLVFNGIIKTLSPERIIGMSATIDKKLAKALFSSSRFEVEYREIPFAFDSTLNLFVFDITYDYENKIYHLQLIAEKIKQVKTDKPVVILSTSYEDVNILSSLLEKDYRVLTQTQDKSVYDLVKEFENSDIDILIGNKSLWEGVNIRKDADFVITKVPFLSPEDVDYKAVQEYSLKDAYPINVKEASISLAQGLGRIIRENNIEKNVYIFDMRIKEFANIIREVPAIIKLAILPVDLQLKPYEKFEYPVPAEIKKQYYCTFKAMQEKILKKEPIKVGDLADLLEECRIDEEYREIFNVDAQRERRDTLFGKLYTRLVVDIIELYKSLSVEDYTNYIPKYFNVSIDYIRSIKKRLEEIAANK